MNENFQNDASKAQRFKFVTIFMSLFLALSTASCLQVKKLSVSKEVL